MVQAADIDEVLSLPLSIIARTARIGLINLAHFSAIVPLQVLLLRLSISGAESDPSLRLQGRRDCAQLLRR